MVRNMIVEILRYCLKAGLLAAYATITHKTYEKYRFSGTTMYLYVSALFAINFIHGMVNLMK